MLEEELIDLVKRIRSEKAESQTTEVKAAHDGCPKRLYDTLSSFSNQDGGGVLVFGLDEKQGFTVCGVYDMQDLLHKVTEQCNQMEPPIRAVFTTAEVEDRYVCAAEIPGIDPADRPCYYKGAGRTEGSYVRVGDADLRMTDYELYSYEAFRKHVHDDERRIERASIQMMDKDRLEEYLRKKRRERPQFSALSDEQAYEMLYITSEGKPTLAAVMNFCIYPQGFLPQLAITAVSVPGKEIGDTDSDTARFTDNKRIEGTLSEMLEEALAFCRRNMKLRTIIDTETGKHIEKTEYPMTAIREAVLNALIHRDYSHYTEGTPIQISFFSDRLEIHSPGSLYGRMTVEKLGFTRPDQRNPALAVMAETMLSAENRYSGIPTMRKEMEKYGLPEPLFQNRRNEFVVTFFNTASEQAPEDANGLLAFCKKPRSRQEIADFLGVKSMSYVNQRYINPNVVSGRLKLTIPETPRSKKQKYYS